MDSSLSYVPERFLGGRHELKFGNTMYWQQLGRGGLDNPQGNYQLVFDAGRPDQIVLRNTPIEPTNRADMVAAYVQDSWRVTDRVTASLGVRRERQRAYLPEQTYAGSSYFSDSVPGWNLSPSGSDDVDSHRPSSWHGMGSRRQAVVETSFGLYNTYIGEGFGIAYNRNAVRTATFRWRDLDGNMDYTDGEVNLNLNGHDFLSIGGGGTAVPAPDLRQPLTTEVTAGFERELMPNAGFRAMYVFKRTSDRYTDVEFQRPRDAYNIPLTRRDPGPDGVLNTVDDGGRATIYDYAAAYRGAAFASVQRRNATSGRADHYNSFEVSLTKRLTNRWSATGSFWATKNYRWLTINDVNPNNDPFPLDQTWFWAGNFTASYLLPADIQLSAYLQSKASRKGQRTYQFRAVDPDGGASLVPLNTVTLRLEQFGSQSGAAENILNFRIGKRIPFGRSRFSVDFEIFNVLNSNAPTNINFASGPTFGFTTGVLPPRVARFGATYSF